jgi:hypothetical protein
MHSSSLKAHIEKTIYISSYCYIEFAKYNNEKPRVEIYRTFNTASTQI